MKEIIIDKEFKSLLPALSKETYASLEANLQQNGCRDALVLWNDILIDGHNRYEICLRHGIPFGTTNKEFTTREEVLVWIITTQVSRRNLSQEQLRYYRGVHYTTDKRIQGTNNQYVQKRESGQKDHLQKSTEKRLSEKYRVSPKTIRRDAKAAEAVDAIGDISPEAKLKILSGESNINKKDLEALAGESKEKIKTVAEKIAKGEYEKEKPAERKTAERENLNDNVSSGMRSLNKAIDNITDAFFTERSIINGESDMQGLKSALRTYIDRLETLYRQL